MGLIDQDGNTSVGECRDYGAIIKPKVVVAEDREDPEGWTKCKKEVG